MSFARWRTVGAPNSEEAKTLVPGLRGEVRRELHPPSLRYSRRVEAHVTHPDCRCAARRFVILGAGRASAMPAPAQVAHDKQDVRRARGERTPRSQNSGAIALAVIGPMPGIVASRRLVSLVRCHLRISASIFLISPSMLRS